MANRKLGRPSDQRMAMLRNQVTNLIWYGKIETALSAVPGIRRGCCLYEHKTQKIVAIYEGNLDQKALTEALKEKLPNYMLPNRYVPLEEMPINLNGKIDRTLLKHQYIKEN